MFIRKLPKICYFEYRFVTFVVAVVTFVVSKISKFNIVVSFWPIFMSQTELKSVNRLL